MEPEQHKTYAEMLAQYHISPESIFERGRFLIVDRLNGDMRS